MLTWATLRVLPPGKLILIQAPTPSPSEAQSAMLESIARMQPLLGPDWLEAVQVKPTFGIS